MICIICGEKLVQDKHRGCGRIHNMLEDYIFYEVVNKRTVPILSKKGLALARKHGVDTSKVTRPTSEDIHFPSKKRQVDPKRNFVSGVAIQRVLDSGNKSSVSNSGDAGEREGL